MNDKVINYTMWLIMLALLGYFAYFKGWIFSNFKNISPQEAHRLLENSKDILIFDVRSQEEFNKDHIKGAMYMPRYIWDVPDSYLNDNRTILVYSERGEKSVEAARILSKRGCHILNLEGGVVFWIRAGYEVVKD